MTLPNIFCREDTKESKSSKEKILLKDISGEAREGEILAILGPSGSGKTTLIDALANRISNGSLKGCVTMNGESLESGVLKVISAYVMQDDLLFPMLTVEETLMFSAEFRLPRSISKSKKMARVQAVIDELGLRNAANTLIGDEGHRGISGGERRRVSIGVDIIHDPIVLFLDEPTSGLDSSCAFMVVKVLQRIARNGRIVIIVHYSSSLGVSLKQAIISSGKLVDSDVIDIAQTSTISKFANPFWVEFTVLLKRSLTNSKRKPKVLMLQICGIVLVGFSLASVYWQQLDKTGGGIQLRIGFFIFIVTSIFFGPADVLALLLQERYIFMRETAYNSYRSSSYVLYHSILVIPSLFIFSIIAASLTFWPVGLHGGFPRFLFHFLVIFASFWSANSVVSFASGLVSQVMLGYIGVSLLFSGFFIPRNSIPSYWLWFHYISAVKYPYQAILLNEFDKPNMCLAEGVAPNNSCLVTGLDILRQQDATDLSKWSCLWITLGMGVRILLYIFLLFGSRNKRK
ncbi:hypothetical protein C5167_020212 [Papaver somniferum]|uniref:ABC transporter domain-containing protein n=1 Tax=Papaver somniferum TaxID=3469 RepID=A0A4Y7IVR3_PAPSO|nr:hypothetical protein C5167_020212 [Papaver somniferum]